MIEDICRGRGKLLERSFPLPLHPLLFQELSRSWVKAMRGCFLFSRADIFSVHVSLRIIMQEEEGFLKEVFSSPCTPSLSRTFPKEKRNGDSSFDPPRRGIFCYFGNCKKIEIKQWWESAIRT